MKALNILILFFVLLSVGCKTQKIASKPEPINSRPETINSATTAKTQTTTSGKAVNTKEERVTAAKGEASDFGSKRYYVILGVFGVYENAQKFKKQLMTEDFFPGILVNESGLYRVSGNSYDDEAGARAKISEIRQKYPDKYSDVWLLVKK